MPKLICIINYGCGNTSSILNSLKFLGYKAFISNKVSDFKKSTHLILPGVGSYPNAIDKVRKNINIKELENQVLKKKKPILGICVGMQILSNYGLEFKKTIGLGWIKGEVKEVKKKPNILPQIGWNNLNILKQESPLFQNIDLKDFFYFVHSFKFCPKNKDDLIALTNYNENFASIVNRENIIGVQFHPEKSQSSGLQLLKNFIENFK